MKEPNDSMEAKPTVLGGGALAWGAYSMGERGGVFFWGGGGWGEQLRLRLVVRQRCGEPDSWCGFLHMHTLVTVDFLVHALLLPEVLFLTMLSLYVIGSNSFPAFHVYPLVYVLELFFCSMNWAGISKMHSTLTQRGFEGQVRWLCYRLRSLIDATGFS